MVLETVKGAAVIPEGAVKVSREEALSYQRSIIRDWNKESDVFFLRNGGHLAVAMMAATSTYIVMLYKKQFRLPSTVVVYSMFVPITVFPMALLISKNKFEEIVTSNVLLMKMSCPMCSQLYYMGLHFLASMVYPMVSSSFLFSVIAEKYETVSVPDNLTEPKEYYKFLYRLTKKGASKFQGLFAVNALILLFMPYMQSVELKNLIKVLREMENSRELTY